MEEGDPHRNSFQMLVLVNLSRSKQASKQTSKITLSQSLWGLLHCFISGSWLQLGEKWLIIDFTMWIGMWAIHSVYRHKFHFLIQWMKKNKSPWIGLVYWSPKILSWILTFLKIQLTHSHWKNFEFYVSRKCIISLWDILWFPSIGNMAEHSELA